MVANKSDMRVSKLTTNTDRSCPKKTPKWAVCSQFLWKFSLIQYVLGTILSIQTQILICLRFALLYIYFLSLCFPLPPSYPPVLVTLPVRNGRCPQFAGADWSPHLSSSAPRGLCPASLCLARPSQPPLAPSPQASLEPTAHKHNGCNS